MTKTYVSFSKYWGAERTNYQRVSCCDGCEKEGEFLYSFKGRNYCYNCYRNELIKCFESFSEKRDFVCRDEEESTSLTEEEVNAALQKESVDDIEAYFDEL